MKFPKQLLFFIALIGLMAAQKPGQNPVKKPAVFKQPKGFVYVPSTPNNPKALAFYVMDEPVTVIDYREFIAYLYSKARIVDANQCLSAVAKEMDPKSKYIVLTKDDPIPLYAAYLSEKHSDAKFKVVCQAVSSQNWKQMRGPADNQISKGKNPYGIKYIEKLNEFRVSDKGKLTAYKDINGYTRGGFRLTLTYITLP